MKAPSSPFRGLDAEGFDKAWISDGTGNTISYLSECSPSADLSPEQLFNDFVGHITGVKTAVTPIEISDRVGVQGEATGAIDGVPVQLSVVVFKKDGCDYILNYSGVTQKFSSEQAHFSSFVENFKVHR